MSLRFNRSITLIELLVAIVLISVIILGINNIGVFSRYQLVTSERRIRLQNDVSICLEHMTKNLAPTIGNESVFGVDTAVVITATTLSAFVDTNANGVRESGAGDYWVRYKFDSSAHTFSYCGQCPDLACLTCSITEMQLAKNNNITSFSASKSGTPSNDFSKGNYVNASITACSDPTGGVAACGSARNPSVTMTTAIYLPSLSTN